MTVLLRFKEGPFVCCERLPGHLYLRSWNLKLVSEPFADTEVLFFLDNKLVFVFVGDHLNFDCHLCSLLFISKNYIFHES